MAKTTSDSILGVIRKESWILDHFEINIALNGAVSNQHAWRRSALSECFSSLFTYLSVGNFLAGLIPRKNTGGFAMAEIFRKGYRPGPAWK